MRKPYTTEEKREMTSSPFFSPCDLSSRHFEQKRKRGERRKMREIVVTQPFRKGKAVLYATKQHTMPLQPNPTHIAFCPHSSSVLLFPSSSPVAGTAYAYFLGQKQEGSRKGKRRGK